MNNFNFLNIVNAQIVKPKNTGIIDVDGHYMVCLSAFVGYNKNIACALFLKISDKLLADSSSNSLQELIMDFGDKLPNILKGLPDYVIGEDYWVSESLYDYVVTTMPDEPDYPTDGSDDSSDGEPEVPVKPEPPERPDDWRDYSWLNYNGIIIIAGPDINKAFNTYRWNAKTIADIERVEQETNEYKSDVIKATVIDLGYVSEFPEDATQEYIDSVEQEMVKHIVMPDYVWYRSDWNITQNTDNYEDLTALNIKDMANLAYFYGKNGLLDYTFTQEELKNIPMTFFKIILKYAVPQNFYTNTNNQIYNAVMNYWANGGTDTASVGLNLVLGGLYASSSTSASNCGCNTSSMGGATTMSTDSCYSLYVQAMSSWLTKMLADTEYYYDWFYMPIGDKCPIPNDVMIDLLIKLLQEFISLGFDLSFTAPSTHCQCPTVTTDNGACNYAIIENYIKVLNWVKNNDIDANENKIKVYGSQFGELLPKLVFA